MKKSQRLLPQEMKQTILLAAFVYKEAGGLLTSSHPLTLLVGSQGT
jgi:hypothetical protein